MGIDGGGNARELDWGIGDANIKESNAKLDGVEGNRDTVRGVGRARSGIAGAGSGRSVEGGRVQAR